jgi:tripartite-type tricarboxylate transporter receptor subunit TctC
MQRSVSTIISGIAALGFAGLSTNAIAQSAEKVYKDRTVTILVGYSAGGTYGRTSLLLSEHLGQYVPGKPTMVVQHMPGAGGIKAANYFYNVAPKNGLVLLMPPEMTVASELLRPNKVKYKTREFTWLGRVFGQNTTLVLLRTAGITSLDQLKSREVIVGSSGKGSPTFLIPTLLNALLKTKLKIIIGYRGSKPLQLATEQNEIQGIALGWTAWTTGRPTWFEGGNKSRVVALVQSGYSRQKGAEHVPLISEFLDNADDKAVAKMLGSAGVLGRGLVLPPGAPSNLVNPLRAAFSEVTKDKAFIRDALRRGLLVDPLEGAEIQKVINELMSTPPSIVKRARQLIFPKSSS